MCDPDPFPHSLNERLPEGEYEVFIDSSLEDGHLTYGEFLLPGETEGEVLFSSHCCHPGNEDLRYSFWTKMDDI